MRLTSEEQNDWLAWAATRVNQTFGYNRLKHKKGRNRRPLTTVTFIGVERPSIQTAERDSKGNIKPITYPMPMAVIQYSTGLHAEWR